VSPPQKPGSKLCVRTAEDSQLLHILDSCGWKLSIRLKVVINSAFWLLRNLIEAAVFQSEWSCTFLITTSGVCIVVIQLVLFLNVWSAMYQRIANRVSRPTDQLHVTGSHSEPSDFQRFGGSGQNVYRSGFKTYTVLIVFTIIVTITIIARAAGGAYAGVFAGVFCRRARCEICLQTLRGKVSIPCQIHTAE
jgi:hypothetical protein